EFVRDLIIGLNFHAEREIREVAIDHLASYWAADPAFAGSICSDYSQFVQGPMLPPVFAAVSAKELIDHGNDPSGLDLGKLNDLEPELFPDEANNPKKHLAPMLLDENRKITISELTASRTPDLPGITATNRYEGVFAVDVDDSVLELKTRI